MNQSDSYISMFTFSYGNSRTNDQNSSRQINIVNNCYINYNKSNIELSKTKLEKKNNKNKTECGEQK